MVSNAKVEPKKRGRKPVRVSVEDAVAVTTAASETPRKARKWDVGPRDWAQYSKTQCPEARQRLLAKYIPLVRNVASRMAMGFPRSVELPDLVNTGVIGLIEAFKNFDPDRGVKFETYAVPRIRGAILDELRALDWVPRSTRAKSREIDRALVDLENQLGRPPEKAELANHMKISERELHLAIEDVSCTQILSLDEVIYREDDNRQVPRIETVQDTNSTTVLGEIEKGELRSFLVVAMDRLTEQEKLVISLYYHEELTLKEIGAVMAISESRVSQIHTRAVGKLRGMVRDRFALVG